MKTIKIIFSLLLMISVNLSAQETDYSAEVAIYLENNGSMNQYASAYDQLLSMLMSQYPKSKGTADGWDYLESNKEVAIGAMKKELIPIYQQNFDRSEIAEMSNFYTSAAGKQLVANRAQMTAAQKEEFNIFYSSDLGKKIIEKQPILTKAISSASENWSRDLYETALSLLKE